MRTGKERPPGAARRTVALAAGVGILLAVTAAVWMTRPSLAGLVDDDLDAAPGRESSAYRAPSRDDARDVANYVETLLRADGAPPPPPAGWRLTELDGVLVVAPVGRARDRGWGTYAVRPGGRPLDVQVPHPRSDRRTEEMGLALFQATQARLLMVAGAHRTAGGGDADVAHRSDTVFAAVSSDVVDEDTVVVQLHGFAPDQHDAPSDVIVSSGTREGSRLVRRIIRALDDAALDACVYGDGCDVLGGTRNVQAEAAREAGAQFLHVEVSARVRDDDDRRDLLVRTLGAALLR